jgi:beta-mannosidase
MKTLTFLVLALLTGQAIFGTEVQTLVPGRFGRAFNGLAAGPKASAQAAYSQPPLTVECWALVRSKNEFNILAANEPKASGTHWELYTYAGSGYFSVYMPGYVPAEIKSSRDITDGQWHYLAMIFEPERVRLYVDGLEAANQQTARNPQAASRPGSLAFGCIDSETLKCDGLIDEVRISEGVRSITSSPAAPFTVDPQTLGLWRMDRMKANGEITDLGRLHNPALTKPILHVSLDELDRKSYKAGPSPLDTPARKVRLNEGALGFPPGAARLSLDGDWQMAEGGTPEQRLAGNWSDAIAAQVPGSVHAALAAAGKIPDPKFGRNDAIAHDKSFETWWFRRDFQKPAAMSGERLVFGGVAMGCSIWLNGELLGTHEGMFGGPEFGVSGRLKTQNTLIVKINPAPGDRKLWNNPDWRTTVVFNNVWGWHYSSIPPLGIWRSVSLEGAPTVALDHPFIATRNAQKGMMDLVVDLKGLEPAWSGQLCGTIAPENFTGQHYSFQQKISSRTATHRVHLRFQIPQPRLWWPNDLGRPNLYRLKLAFLPETSGVPDVRETTFGIRTIEMAPLPGGPRATEFNWTFVINGRPTFIKGSGWCTMDSSMDFSRERYDRFLTLAQLQHVQMLRGWGSGMPETDEFYDLCDRKGILVLQEWPTAWDSHLVQPYDLLEETVHRNTLRIRNHPSLAMYGGGNESGNPFGKAIDMMGRTAIELDGTRTFHRGEPWGGSMHNYDCYWGREPLDHNLGMTASFFGEFGLACMPVYESVLRYLPEAEKSVWPPAPEGSLVHHTPIFGTADDWSRLSQYSAYFVPPTDLKTFIAGSQLSQAVGVRHTLELARTRWPDCTGALYYKMNDNYPAASWACADWYGAPKIGHYFFQSAFAPLHACMLFNTLSNQANALSAPIVLLDDADALKGAKWEVTVTAFNAQLQPIQSESHAGKGSIARTRKLGEFKLTAQQTQTTPLLLVAEVKKDGKLADRTFYFLNYEAVKGSLFALPPAHLKLRTRDGHALVTNEGSVPAVGVAVLRPGHLDTFTAGENYFWLNPGETRAVNVNSVQGLTVEAFNAKPAAEIQ